MKRLNDWMCADPGIRVSVAPAAFARAPPVLIMGDDDGRVWCRAESCMNVIINRNIHCTYTYRRKKKKSKENIKGER